MKINKEAQKAIKIGSLCSIAYLAVYIARNILSAVTPQMIEAGYTEEYIGRISSLYFVFYAVGQLINGAIGDRIKAKWMIGCGLLGAGVANFVFARVTMYPTGVMLAYAITGFCLSMIYGPMTKTVAENTEPLYATRCSLGYTFASFFGSPSAGLLATFLVWQSVFTVSSAVLATMALLVFIFFTMFERNGTICYGQFKAEKKGKQALQVLFQRQIVKFACIAVLTGIIRTSVVFWLPTYLAQRLGFTSQESTSIFTIATFIISFTSFISIFIYERLGRDMHKTVLIMFASSSVFFLLTYIVQLPILNIIFIVIAIMSACGASTMLYSRYCPSLRDTGRVSSVTGFLDFTSYMSAAIGNTVFASLVSFLGWSNLVLIWCVLMVIGVIIALPHRCQKAKAPAETNTDNEV